MGRRQSPPQITLPVESPAQRTARLVHKLCSTTLCPVKPARDRQHATARGLELRFMHNLRPSRRDFSISRSAAVTIALHSSPSREVQLQFIHVTPAPGL